MRIDTVFPKGETVATEAVPDTTIVFANEDSSQTVGETTVENPEVEPEAVSPKVIARVNPQGLFFIFEKVRAIQVKPDIE